jgi:uncharacterized membrane protein (Fun14 family)
MCKYEAIGADIFAVVVVVIFFDRYMDGFRWALKRGQPCINLYFPGWTLNTAGKFIAAMIGVTILAVLAEAISKLRHNLSKQAKIPAVTQAKARKLRLTQTGLHGMHAFTGYTLMLATMTFALEFMVCVIVGLVLGYAIFGGDTYSHVTTNPCCAFLEDEANERILDAATRENSNTPQDASDVECCQVGDMSQEQATISDGASSIGANEIDVLGA